MKGSPFTAVFDACVLYPAPLRDFLMWLALSGLFRARWTDLIQSEWVRNLLRNRPDLQPAQLQRTIELMNNAVPDALVTGHADLIHTVTLPDPDDRHVVAAAIHCNASVIVTFNERDFPADQLATFEIEVLHPDHFIRNLLGLNQAAVIAAAQKHRSTLKNPPIGADRYLEILLKMGLNQTVKGLAEFRAVL
jgi:predicted nucleic acid-binding protein